MQTNPAEKRRNVCSRADPNVSAWDRLNQFKGEHLTVVKCRVNSDVTQARKLCLKRSSVMKHIANQKHIKLKTVIVKTNKKDQI